MVALFFWHEFQTMLVIGWPLHQSLDHSYPSISHKQGRLQFKGYLTELASQSLHLYCLVTGEEGQFRLHACYCQETQLGSSLQTLGRFPCSRVLNYPRNAPPPLFPVISFNTLPSLSLPNRVTHIPIPTHGSSLTKYLNSCPCFVVVSANLLIYFVFNQEDCIAPYYRRPWKYTAYGN